MKMNIIMNHLTIGRQCYWMNNNIVMKSSHYKKTVLWNEYGYESSHYLRQSYGVEYGYESSH